MSEQKLVDPRLQAREQSFQQLHLSSFETMGYARTIQEMVAKTGLDIESDNTEYLQLLRDYQITRNLATIKDAPIEALCAQTNALLEQTDMAYANQAQLCAAATTALNYWRILSDIPLDLRDDDTVSKALKEKFAQYMETWEYILQDLA
ncbi:hypothetical protein ACOI22_08155 [Glaciecola sp. 2405UD65-10]|uniref:hypothetical protein n=1 Tax=Glaciecola sp. 2405UD65-10 TaxID=3397244 RepID=UPI003B5BD0B4